MSQQTTVANRQVTKNEGTYSKRNDPGALWNQEKSTPSPTRSTIIKVENSTEASLEIEEEAPNSNFHISGSSEDNAAEEQGVINIVNKATPTNRMKEERKSVV